MATIGGVIVEFIEAFEVSGSRRNTTVDIPYGYQLAYLSGINLPAYNIQSTFYGETEAIAKSVRARLGTLANNLEEPYVYIEFDTDQAELSGWFLIDSLNVSINGEQPGFYPFTFSAKKISGTGANTLTPAVYYDDTTTFSSTCYSPTPWISIPNEYNGPNITIVENTIETIQPARIIIDPTDSNLQTLSGLDASSLTYNSRCHMIDTVTAVAQPNWIDNKFFPTGTPSTWTEISNPNQATGDIIFSNDLIRMVWRADGSINVSHMVGRADRYWDIHLLNMHFSSDATNNTAPFGAATTRPRLLSASNNKLVWVQDFLDVNDTELPDQFRCIFTLRRGARFISGELTCIGTENMRGAGSGFDTRLGSFGTLVVANCASSVIGAVTDQTSLSGFFNSDVAGAISSANVRFPESAVNVGDAAHKFAIYGMPTDISQSASAAAVSAEIAPVQKQWLGAMDQQLVFLAPWEAF